MRGGYRGGGGKKKKNRMGLEKESTQEIKGKRRDAASRDNRGSTDPVGKK